MPDLLPARFLFRYSFSVRYEAKLPRSGKNLLALTDAHALSDLAELDGSARFADVRLAWNERGLGIAVEVRGRTSRPSVDPNFIEVSDRLQVWIDTRNTQSIHRASRHCHSFCLFPRGGGSDGNDPVALQIPIARAREEAPIANLADLRLKATLARQGYLLETWIPARALNGFEPEDQPRLGFYYHVFDGELGDQHLTVGPEFPFALDPSLWSTLELERH